MGDAQKAAFMSMVADFVKDQQGVDREQLAAILAQTPPEAAQDALERSRKTVVALCSIGGAMIRGGYLDVAAHALRRLFYLGWQAAQDDSVGQITADDIGD